MGVFRFIHAADLHLGSPFKGLQSLDEWIGERLVKATFDAFDNIIAACIENKVDFLLVAGDVFNAEDRGLGAQLHFRNGLARLAEACISSYVVYGNHDPLSGWSAHLNFPEAVKIFGAEFETVPFVRDGETLAHIQGISFAKADVRENLVKRFRRPADSPFSIGLVHANVGTDTGHEPYAPCTMDDLIAAGMDYWALGHVHKCSVLRKNDPTVVYPGNPQGLHINEPGARGIYLITVTDGAVTEPEFIPTDLVRWFNLSSNGGLDVSSIEKEGELFAILEERCEAIVGEADGRSAIVRLALTGRTPLHRRIARADFLSELERHLREKFAPQGSEPLLWIDRIMDMTRSPVDIEARRAAGGFLADLLMLTGEMRDDAERLSRLTPIFAKLYEKNPAWTRDIASPDVDELRAIVDDAESLLVDLLLPEDAE